MKPPDEHAKKQELHPAMLPHRWQKGQSGNPGGRAKGSLSLKNELAKQLKQICPGDREKRKNFQVLIQAEILRALKGDKEARKLIWDRIEGLPDAQVNLNAQGEFTVVLTSRNGDRPEGAT